MVITTLDIRYNTLIASEKSIYGGYLFIPVLIKGLKICPLSLCQVPDGRTVKTDFLKL
jgi:hypothetical protein